MKKFLLKSSLFDRSRWLVLEPHQLSFEARDVVGEEYTTVSKETIADIRHGVEWLQWYKFFVGRRYRLSFKTTSGNVLSVSFSSYFGLRRDYANTYATIVETLWEYYLNDMAKGAFFELQNGAQLTLQHIRISFEGVWLNNAATPWHQLSTHDYETYFAIFKKSDPDLHKLVTFNAWGAEILWALCKKLVAS